MSESTSPSPLSPGSFSQFRVYRGQDAARPTLSMFAEELYIPRRMLARNPPARPGTIAEVRSAVNHWCEGTEDPPLTEITPAICAGFVAWLRSRPGQHGKPLADDTIYKIVSALQSIIDFAGPADSRCKRPAAERGFFGEDDDGRPRSAPWFPDVARGKHLPRQSLSLSQIEDLLRATAAAQEPAIEECSAPAWWSALYRFAFWTGLRRGSLMAARRQWIRREAKLVWIQIPGEFYKGGCPKAIWLHPRALAAIESIGTKNAIFPWPHCLKYLETIHKRLLIAAGILTFEDFGLHSFRRAIGSTLYEVNPAAAPLLLQHNQTVTIKSYVQIVSRVRGQREVLKPALDRIAKRHPAL